MDLNAKNILGIQYFYQQWKRQWEILIPGYFLRILLDSRAGRPAGQFTVGNNRFILSQLSPIFSSAGNSLPKTSRSLCPPQIRCL